MLAIFPNLRKGLTFTTKVGRNAWSFEAFSNLATRAWEKLWKRSENEAVGAARAENASGGHRLLSFDQLKEVCLIFGWGETWMKVDIQE